MQPEILIAPSKASGRGTEGDEELEAAQNFQSVKNIFKLRQLHFWRRFKSRYLETKLFILMGLMRRVGRNTVEYTTVFLYSD